MINFFDTDSYKVSQWKQYPKGAEYAMSYVEARGPKGGYTIFFGLQYILKQLKVPTVEEVVGADNMAKTHFGRGDIFNLEGWMDVAELGYFPLIIRAVPEGTKVPNGNALVTVENSLPGYAWLVSWFETQILRVWYPTNVATISHEIKTLINGFLQKNGTPETLKIKLHDFGSRGASTGESAMVGGMGHLVNFAGTDTLAAWMGAIQWYEADPGSLAFSIPASEHSTITSWGKDFEIDAFRNMIEQYGGEGSIYACVSDSYDIWAAIGKWKELEPLILEKGGTLVIRPDSGDPVKTPVDVVMRCLDTFGYTFNPKGYKVLPDHIRVIQGDGIEKETIRQILHNLDMYRVSSDNINFGMGGALLQKHDRDTSKFAMKMSGIIVDGEERDVFKDPVTDPGKTSKKGFLTLGVDEDLNYFTARRGEVKYDAMIDVYDGEVINPQTFDDIRERADRDFE